MIAWWPLEELERFDDSVRVLGYSGSIEVLAHSDLSFDEGLVPLLLDVPPGRARSLARMQWPRLLARARATRCTAPVALAVLVYSTRAAIWWHNERDGVAFSPDAQERKGWSSLTPS